MPDGHASTSDPAIAGVFRQPFTEQVAFFRRKLGNLVPTQSWDDMLGAAHDDGFMVAGAAKADLLTDLAAATDKAISEGVGLEAFRADFRAIVAKHGWTGWTGEGSVKGEAWRVKTIYRTNMMTSYAAGRMAQLRAENWPLWLYRHGGSREPRPQHLSWDGWAGPPDHPFWQTHYPPSDWGCSCFVLGARSARGVRRLGGDPDKDLPKGWDRIDRRTGAPVGIGKGWNYAPGASVSPTVQAMAGKIGKWDHRIATAYLEDLPQQQADALSQAYRDLPSTADDVRRFAQRVYDRTERGTDDMRPLPTARTLGMARSEQLAQINVILGHDPDDPAEGYDFAIDLSGIGHVRKRHGPPSNDPMPINPYDFAILPQIVSKPDSISRGEQIEGQLPTVKFVRSIGGKVYEALFELRKGKRSLVLKTFYVARKER